MAELMADGRNLRHEIFNLRLQQASAQLEKPARLRTLRRDIAKAQSDGRSGDDLVTAVTAELKDTYGNWGFFNYFIKPDITFTAAELKGTKRIPVPAKD